MAGKRLVDLAALFNAARNVARQHASLRSQEWESYTKSSSVAKAVKNQGDRVTLTVQAASALASRVNETRPAPHDLTPDDRAQSISKVEEVPAKNLLWETSVNSSSQAGNTKPENELPSRVGHKDELSADQARKAQRAAEFQIPSEAAEQDPGSSKATLRDNFYTAPQKTEKAFSSLPRVKLPKHSESLPEELKNPDINSDLYYSPGETQAGAGDQRGDRRDDETPEGINTAVFNSPRVAKLLGEGGQHENNPYLKLHEKNKPFGRDDGEEATSKSASTAPPVTATGGVPFSQPTGPIDASSHPQEDDFAKLGNEMARDAELHSTDRTSIVEPESKTPYQLRESRVPASRIGRLWHYGGLATGLALGAVGESFRRVTGSVQDTAGSLMLSPGNIDRLVAKLSRMRGAALKLGQMMSFQDSRLLPAAVQEVLQRVQDSADYMPASQRNKVLVANLGPEWRDLFSSFDEVPMAAASIGQVHGAILKSTGQRVAVKVQYPGVANSIDSDLSNLSVLLTASRLLPKGLYLDKSIANARVELGWECDYIREAECAKRYKDLLQDDQDVFTVPQIIDEASGKEVLTMTRMDGTGVTKSQNLTQEQKNWIGTQILRLCLREITEFRFMQTDPNWTNFLFSAQAHKLELLDFGASREYPMEFIDPYIRVLLAASRDDRVACRDLSIQLGYLTGHESQSMLNAHVSSILTLAEPFRESSPDIYDFRDQTITDRVRDLIPVMVRERLAPPPEETYSLHRKLSGAFLLCARLGSKVPCRELFRNALEKAGYA